MIFAGLRHISIQQQPFMIGARGQWDESAAEKLHIKNRSVGLLGDLSCIVYIRCSRRNFDLIFFLRLIRFFCVFFVEYILELF